MRKETPTINLSLLRVLKNLEYTRVLKNPNMDSKLGSYDFYFDIADKLESLGCPFALSVLHPQTNNIVLLSNVQDEELARKMVISLDRTFNERFSKGEGDGI